MTAIRDKSSLKDAYQMIKLLNYFIETGGVDKEVAEDLVKEKTKAIRSYYRRQEAAAERAGSVVRDDGIDGYVIKFPLPSFIESIEDADEYFREELYIRPTYCAWDCTGRPFTSWYKVFRKPDGSIWAYHSIAFDV